MQETNQMTPDYQLFKTWWVQLSAADSIRIQQDIKQQLGWSRDTWYDRIHGRTAFTYAEKRIIIQIVGTDVFAQPENK